MVSGEGTSLDEILEEMKRKYVDAFNEDVQLGSNKNRTSLIRSKKLINILHQFVINKLIELGIPPNWIWPNQINPSERKVYGFPKPKDQDIIVEPPQNRMATGPIISINVRSQLSSIGKNYDTLFERLFAEALNLHTRFPYLVAGYLYLLPTVGFNSEPNPDSMFEERINIEKYIYSFLSISGREDPDVDPPWKYERICLLLVDFERDPPYVVRDLDYLVERQLVSEDFAEIYRDSFKTLIIDQFFDEIYKIAVKRYPFVFFGSQSR